MTCQDCESLRKFRKQFDNVADTTTFVAFVIVLLAVGYVAGWWLNYDRGYQQCVQDIERVELKEDGRVTLTWKEETIKQRYNNYYSQWHFMPTHGPKGWSLVDVKGNKRVVWGER